MKLKSFIRPLWLAPFALFCAVGAAYSQSTPVAAPPVALPAATPTAFTPPVVLPTPTPTPAPAPGATPAPGTVVTPPVAAPVPTPTPTPSNAATAPADLKLFGRDLFESSKGFEAGEETNAVPSNYVLGPGDTLSILVWNGSNEYERANVPITPSGSIYLKLIGALPVSEMTLSQVENELQSRYARFYKKFNLRVQVVGRRTIPVFVVGEVEKPGKYLLSSLSTVFTALYAAGGPTDNGSLRGIQLKRRQQNVGTVDIYKYLISGVTVDLPLRAGDTVFVPVAGTVVAMAGEVRRPAKYELAGRETLRSAIELAGGATANSTGRIKLSRVDDNRRRVVTEISLATAGATPLRDGDELTLTSVLPQLGNAVFLMGAANRPGSYALDQAPTVAALLKRGEGVSPEAYAEQAVIIRRNEKQERSQISVNLRAILSGAPNSDITLQPDDVLRIYNRTELTELPDLVTVQGEVLRPGSYPFTPNMRVRDLVSLAFGPTTRAFLPQAQIYRYQPGQQPQQVTVDLAKAVAGDAVNNVMLHARDQLVVRSRDDVKDMVVRVEGEVFKPGTFPYYIGMKVSDVIFNAGGLKTDVALDQAWLVRLNDQTYAEELISISLRDVMAHNPKEDIALQNQDRLIVYPVTQLGEFRQVRIEGAVRKPNTFPYFGGMRVSQLIFNAEGLQDNAYTDRGDLYRYLPDNTIQIIPINLTKAIRGEEGPDNPLVQPRDRLVVSTREKMEEARLVKIDGYVRQPGQYPLTEGMKLSDLLHLAGGLKPDAQQQLDLYRVTEGKVQVESIPVAVTNDIYTVAKDIPLQARDLVSVQGNADFFNVTETVSVNGAIAHPGTYPAYVSTRRNPKTLFQMLKEVGGLLPEAYPKGIVLYRAQATIHTQRQQDELDIKLKDLDRSVGLVAPGTKETPTPPAAGATGAADEVKAQNIAAVSRTLAQVLITNKGNSITLVAPPRSMQEQKASASVPVDGENIIRTQGKMSDVTLEPGDIIFVPKRPTTVTIVGGVVNNGTVLFAEDQPLKFYYAAAGGISPDGDGKRVVVMRLNGRVLPMNQVKKVEPGDVIIVPTKFTTNVIHTQGTLERTLQTLSETVLSFVPFIAVNN